MCGRAGRAGCQARAHLLVKSDTDKITDPALRTYCTDKENCLRSTMIRSLGSTVQQGTLSCCMVCNPPEFLDDHETPDILEVGKAPPRKKRRIAVRKMDKSLLDAINERLKAERAKYIAEHPTLAIVGEELVCPDSVIDSICSNVKFISVVNDMDTFSLRQELKQRFFNVIMSAL